MVVVVAFSFRGRMFDNSFLIRPGSVHSGLARWDDCGRLFPDELRVSTFADSFPHYACTAAWSAHSHWVKDARVFRSNLPPALLAGWPGCFTCHCSNTGVERTPNKSQHTELTPEKNILPLLLPGFEPATFRWRVRCSYQLPCIYVKKKKKRLLIKLYLILFIQRRKCRHRFLPPTNQFGPFLSPGPCHDVSSSCGRDGTRCAPLSPWYWVSVVLSQWRRPELLDRGHRGVSTQNGALIRYPLLQHANQQWVNCLLLGELCPLRSRKDVFWRLVWFGSIFLQILRF